ncbi:MAG: hypothetical protein ACRD3B_05050 [Candidatus Sulfotelmatobacter sp.]
MTEQGSSPFSSSSFSAGSAFSEHLPEWQREYAAAFSESDTAALFKRVEVAEAAIMTCLEPLLRSVDSDNERRALEDALNQLRIIKRDRLKFNP